MKVEYFYYMEERSSSQRHEDLAVIDTCPHVPGIRSWHMGEKFSAQITEPLIFDMNDDYPGRLPDYFDDTVPLFSDSLITALCDSSVDTIDTYLAHLVDRKDHIVSSQYKAVNIIGRLSLSQLQELKSNERPLLFREDEHFRIVVHEKVKDHLLNSGFGKLGFSHYTSIYD